MAERSRTTIYLDQADRDAIKAIREASGCGTDASAVRFAIRDTAARLARRPKRTVQTPHDDTPRTDD